VRVLFSALSENASNNRTSAGELQKPAELVTSQKRKSTDNEVDEPTTKKPTSGISIQWLLQTITFIA